MNIKKQIQFLALLPVPISTLFNSLELMGVPAKETILAESEMSLENRQPDPFVNGVFKYNILLTLAYLRGEKADPLSPFSYQFSLKPNQLFAFHDGVAQKYQSVSLKHTNAHFNAQEGFKTDGYLYGDGVCHLASLINLVAQKAGLEVEAPTNHNFAQIPDISKEYGVSIYSNPYSKGSNAQQNLYITNNKEKPVSFKFEYDGQKVKVSVVEQD